MRDVLRAVDELAAAAAAAAAEEGEGGEQGSSVRGAVLEFIEQLRVLAAQFGSANGAAGFVDRGFQACDTLRSKLRKEGTALTDKQTEGSYNARVKGLAAAGDYMLTVESLHRLRIAFGEPTVDAFASGATALLPRFWSADDALGAEGIDAFTQNWKGERLLVHAPVGLLANVIEKLDREKAAAAVVVAPFWTGAPWFEPVRKVYVCYACVCVCVRACVRTCVRVAVGEGEYLDGGKRVRGGANSCLVMLMRCM